MEAATEDEAPLIEKAVKIEVSMPDASNSDFSHRDTVLEEIALWSSIIATSNLVYLPQRGWVLFSWALSAATGHNCGSSASDESKKCTIC